MWDAVSAVATLAAFIVAAAALRAAVSPRPRLLCFVHDLHVKERNGWRRLGRVVTIANVGRGTALVTAAGRRTGHLACTRSQVPDHVAATFPTTENFPCSLPPGALTAVFVKEDAPTSEPPPPEGFGAVEVLQRRWPRRRAERVWRPAQRLNASTPTLDPNAAASRGTFITI